MPRQILRPNGIFSSVGWTGGFALVADQDDDTSVIGANNNAEILFTFEDLPAAAVAVVTVDVHLRVFAEPQIQGLESYLSAKVVVGLNSLLLTPRIFPMPATLETQYLHIARPGGGAYSVADLNAIVAGGLISSKIPAGISLTEMWLDVDYIDEPTDIERGDAFFDLADQLPAVFPGMRTSREDVFFDLAKRRDATFKKED